MALGCGVALTCRSMCSSMKLVLSRMSKPSSRAVVGGRGSHFSHPWGSHQLTEVESGLSLPPQPRGKGNAHNIELPALSYVSPAGTSQPTRT